MAYDPKIHHRRSVRLKGYDYSREGAYFVTICTQSRECFFGEVVDGRMDLNLAGQIVGQTWQNLPKRFSTIDLDEFIVMPNHVHFILWIKSPTGAQHLGARHLGAQQAAPLRQIDVGALLAAPPYTLGRIVRAFKSISAIEINRHRNRRGIPVWQRNYYERIIRDDDELNEIREYIINNPLKWDCDENNPNVNP